MNVSAETITGINRDFAHFSLPEARLEPVRVEVDQFAAAIAAVRDRLRFDSEPADFTEALLDAARMSDRD